MKAERLQLVFLNRLQFKPDLNSFRQW